MAHYQQFYQEIVDHGSKTNQTLKKKQQQMDQLQQLNSTLGQVEQDLRDDLDSQKNLKLEVATYFGKPRTFFDCLAMPGGDGHARVYQFIKRLYSQVESLRVINAVPSQS